LLHLHHATKEATSCLFFEEVEAEVVVVAAV
jgi:hypothetical protein